MTLYSETFQCCVTHCDSGLDTLSQMMQCDHFICLTCEMALAERALFGTLKCPACRTVYVPERRGVREYASRLREYFADSDGYVDISTHPGIVDNYLYEPVPSDDGVTRFYRRAFG